MADREPEDNPDPPPPSDPRAPTELPRLPSAGSSRGGSARQPPGSAGLVREGLLGTGGIGEGLGRSASTPAVGVGTPPRQLSRNPSRDRLDPLGTPPAAPLPEAESTPRRSQPQLAPLTLPGSGSRGGSRPGTAERDRPVGVPPLDLGSPDVVCEPCAVPDGTAGAYPAGGVPAPPQPVETDEDRMARRGIQPASDAPTARGPVKWVPHTHANPKHAKFCFICLHGRLEGQKDTGGNGSVSEEVGLRTEEEDLPPPTELKDLGYLLPGSVRFRRAGADFEKENITAHWLKDVTHRMYGETVKGMVSKQNEDIIHGRDVKLVDHKEDLKDREYLERLFTLTEQEMDGLDQKLSKLASWCRDEEARLLNVAPEPRPLGDLPEVSGPAPEQTPGLEYKPLVDLSELKGDTAHDAREAMKEADSLITGGAKRGFDGFQVESLPAPETYADMPEVKLVPYEIHREDLPPYERAQPQKPTRRPIEAMADPFSRPFLFLPEFEETAMPVFSGTAVRGQARSTKPLPAEEEWLSKTRSMFADNNVDDEGEEYGWGMVPDRGRIMPPLVDDPYLPPDDLVDEGTGKKKYVVRSVWDPELFTQEGRMVPPIKELARALYKPPPFPHPEDPIWSLRLAPKQNKQKKVNDLVGLIPVYSFARFKPKRISVTMPDFLWDLVRKDASNQSMWDVLKQRHEIPIELRKEEEKKFKAAMEAEERLRAADDEDPLSPKLTQDVEEGEEDEEEDREDQDRDGADGDPVADITMEAPLQAAGDTIHVLEDATTEPFGGASSTQAPRRVTEARQGMPEVEVDIPPAPRPVGEIEGQAPVSPMRSLATTQEHFQRVKDLPDKSGQLGGAGRKIEEIMQDDRFIDTLAEKICLRMGGAGAGIGVTSPGATMRSTMQGNWAAGVLSGKETLDGQPTAQILQPDPPSFAEPVDEQSKAELPRALQGNMIPPREKPEEQQGGSISDSNIFTQEKMRGECYVRLLMKPEENAARKIPMPFRPETCAPDSELISKRSRPHLRMPPKPPVVSEDGEILEEDEYQDFEKSNEIVFSFVRHNRYDAVEALIQQDQDVIHATDETGNTLLHTACQNNNRRLAKLLLKNHITINLQNSRGNTSLHYCYQYGFSDLAEYLLAHGADDSILNQDGFVPAQGTGRAENLTSQQHAMRTGG